jgi:hypothetical protein
MQFWASKANCAFAGSTTKLRIFLDTQKKQRPRLRFSCSKKLVQPTEASRKTLGFLAIFVRNGQFLTTMCAARSQHATTIGRGHSFAETMFVFAFSVRWLKRSFHLYTGFIVSNNSENFGLQR